jgi:hypothetical protein
MITAHTSISTVNFFLTPQTNITQQSHSHYAPNTKVEESTQALPHAKAKPIIPANVHHTHNPHCPYTPHTSHYTSAREISSCNYDDTKNIAEKIQVRGSHLFTTSSRTNASTPNRVHSKAPFGSKLPYRFPLALGGDSLYSQPTHIPFTPPVNINTSHQIQKQLITFSLEQSALLTGTFHNKIPNCNWENTRSSHKTIPFPPSCIQPFQNCPKTQHFAIVKSLISAHEHHNTCQGKK